MEDASLQRLTTATLAAALLLGAATGARAQLGEILDPGAAYLFQLGHVTIVYPAGPGEDAERNRRSAERKAAFVGGREVRVTVRADTELTDEERAGNLLLLGWTNRLLETEELSGIVERLDDGFRFLGRTVNEPHADLLFFVPNPYDEYRDVMFWSRIDPELDRFMVLPVIGSHWAIFHDFLPVEQGMLSADRSWPPRRKPAAEKDHRNDIRIKLSSRASIEGSHYTLGYDPEVLTKAEARSILAAREAALARAADLLGTELGDFRGRLEIYADPTSKVELTGVPDPVHTLDRRGELHMVRRVARSASPHEEIHLLAHRDLGPAFLTAPYEGLVLLLENRHRGMDLELHAAVLIEKGLVPDLLTVLDDERLRALPEEARFPSAGLMMGWVRSTGGAAALERVYGLEAGTLEALGRALERKPETLEDEFRAWTAAYAAERRTEVAYLKLMAEAREHHLIAEYADVARLMLRALELRPDDPQALYNLAYAEARTGEIADAERRLRRLLELKLPADARWTILAHFDLGRVLDLQGRRDEAVAQYRRVLEFPGQPELHLRAQEAIESPVTADSLR